LWWNQDYGRLFIYYNDGTSNQWVDATLSPDISGIYGVANAANLVASASFNVANAAFGKANTTLQNTSGTFAGSLTTTGDITSGGTLTALTTVQSSSGADLSLNANGANRDVIMKVNGTELARVVGSTGYVGIGNTSPQSRLHVANEIRIGRTDASQEGGELKLCRASDDAAQYSIDVYGSGSSPALRMFDSQGGTVFFNASPGGVNYIKFNPTQQAVGDANALDDYEEGTWTPIAAPASGSLTSYSSSGRYTKIGNLVNIYGLIVLTNVGTAAGSLSISGIPFPTPPGTTYGQIPSVVREQNSSGLLYQMILNNNGVTTGAIFNITNGNIAWTNNYAYSFQITYATS
jgi:hypothetical protein